MVLVLALVLGRRVEERDSALSYSAVAWCLGRFYFDC